MLMDEVSSQEPGTSMEELQQVWKGIWKIQTPNRIHHFIWRATRDSLPTKLNLRARHFPLEDACELCGDYQETTLHSLWLCEHAQAVWKSDITFTQYYRKCFRTFLIFWRKCCAKGRSIKWLYFLQWCGAYGRDVTG